MFTLAVIAFVRNQHIRQFMMDAFALLAAESPNDEDHCIPHAVHAISPPAAYRVQFTATAWTGDLLRAPYKKHLSESFQQFIFC